MHAVEQVEQRVERVEEAPRRKTVYLTVRVTEEEKGMLEALAEYLHRLGKIPEPTVSNAVRLCIYFTVNEILKAIEAERYGKK